jgi:hypothetical protein
VEVEQTGTQEQPEVQVVEVDTEVALLVLELRIKDTTGVREGQTAAQPMMLAVAGAVLVG